MSFLPICQLNSCCKLLKEIKNVLAEYSLSCLGCAHRIVLIYALSKIGCLMTTLKLRDYENVYLTIIHDPEVASRSGVGESQLVTESSVKEALLSIKSCSSKLTLVFKKLIKMPAQDVWQYSEIIVEHIADLQDAFKGLMLKDFLMILIALIVASIYLRSTRMNTI